MSYILDDWKDALEAFQDCVDKELAEIQQQKAEVQQLKAEVFNQLGGGLFYRDGDRIVISAPEIVIGNVDRSGTLQNGGAGKVIIRANDVAIEGVGETGQVATRAPRISQLAVDPGIDGEENVVCDTSQVITQACDIVLHSSDATEVFSQAPVTAGQGGIRIHADKALSLEAAATAESRQDEIDGQLTALETLSSDLKSQMKGQKSTIDDLFGQMTDLLDEEEGLNQEEDYQVRTNVKDLAELRETIEDLEPVLFGAIKTFLSLVSQLAEVNRKKTALETEKGTITTGNDFKNNTTEATMRLNAEIIMIETTDGEGNLHTNSEAGITVRTPRMGISMKDDEGKLVEGGSFDLVTENISLVAQDATDEEGKESSSVGKVNIRSKDITLEAMDYKTDDNYHSVENALTEEGSIQLKARTVKVSTSNPKDLTYDADGKLTGGEYAAEGDVIINTKNLTVESLDYEVADGELKPKAQTAESTFTVRAEKTSILSADAEGKAAGSFTANAKAVNLKSMDVDKDSLADSALAAGGTTVLVSEKMYVGAKSKDVKSKKLQAVSEEMGLFADKTLEAQQGDGKAVVQLNGGNANVGGSKTQVYGDTTINAKTEVKGELKAPKATIDNLEAKSSFKSSNISDGIAVPAAAAGGSLSAKLSVEDAPAEEA
jgi:hypothetical protein